MEVEIMVMKSSKKEVNCEFIRAQSISKTQLNENSTKKEVCKPVISDVKTGHCTPDTGNKEIRIGPKENRTPNLYHVKVASYHSTMGPEKECPVLGII